MIDLSESQVFIKKTTHLTIILAFSPQINLIFAAQKRNHSSDRFAIGILTAKRS